MAMTEPLYMTASDLLGSALSDFEQGSKEAVDKGDSKDGHVTGDQLIAW